MVSGRTKGGEGEEAAVALIRDNRRACSVVGSEWGVPFNKVAG